MNRKIRSSNMTLFLITIMLLLICLLCVKGIVKNTGNRIVRDDKNYVLMEKEYIRSVRQNLEDAGVESAGIMLTKVINEDGSRNYTLSLNHRAFEDKKHPERLKGVLDKISAVRLDIPDSDVIVMTGT